MNRQFTHITMSAIPEFESAMKAGMEQGIIHEWDVTLSVEYDLSAEEVDVASQHLDALFHSATPARDGDPTHITNHSIGSSEFDDRAKRLSVSTTVQFEIPMESCEMARVFALTILGNILQSERSVEDAPPITDYAFESFEN